MPQRGVIENRGRKKQINDFSGLRYGNITPTDIDGLLDFGDRVFFIFEIKYGDNELPFGQRLAIERVTDNIQSCNKDAIAVVASHDIHDTETDVPCHECIVRQYRYMGSWKNAPPKMRLDRFIDHVLEKLGYKERNR